MNLKALALSLAGLVGTSALASDWTDKVSLGGDFRFRHEQHQIEASSGSTMVTNERNRTRYRVRLEVTGEVEENLKIHTRLASGGTSINSGNQTMEDDGANDSIGIDKAYAAWTPGNHTVWMGKFGTPFFRPANSQLIWDGDYTPEGLSYQFSCQCENGPKWMLNTAALSMRESCEGSANEEGQSMVGAQAGVKMAFGEPTVEFHIGYLSFNNFKGTTFVNSNAGNNTSTNGTTYDYDFHLSTAALEMKADVAGIPTGIFVDYVQNGDPSKDNTGFLAGFYLGKIKGKGDWVVSYNFRDIEKDAVISQLQDSDFADGQTDAKGHTLGLKYGIFEKGKFALTHFQAERGASTATPLDFTRTHLDFIYKY